MTQAQQDVAEAEKELAEATAALAAAQARRPARRRPSPPPPVRARAPLVSSATVNRVKQADADFTTAQQGITDQTPLKQASQQFNAAAVALEMSWLRLFAEAGCLTDEQQKQAEAAVRAYTSALQNSLADAGYYQGQVDGVYGPETVDAVVGPPEGARPARHRNRRQGHRRGTAGRPPGQGRGRRPAGDRLDRGGPADAEARRILDRPGRRQLDPGPDRGPEDLPGRARRQADRAVDAATVAALEDALAEARKPPASPAATPSS